MTRVYNFSAGPASLPDELLKKAASEMLEYRDSGMSVMEMSHRSKDFVEIINSAEESLRKLLSIPENYEVLFLQGGASSQFAMVPLNLFRKSNTCDLVNTGSWTKKAISEAKLYGTVNIIGSSEDKNFSYIPELDRGRFNPDADYFYICTNNTIFGTRYTDIPETGSVPLVADMSSNILSEVIDVRKFGLIFAGAQKNIGPSGLTIVIIRKDLIGSPKEFTPTMFKYATHTEAKSMYNTPPTYCIYMAGLMFNFILQNGGLTEMEKTNRHKAGLLYDFLDNSGLFSSTAAFEHRSLMNVPFITGSEELDEKFIREASGTGLVTLKGHRSVGGMRASIYNSMPVAGVEKLVNFMKKFEKEN